MKRSTKIWLIIAAVLVLAGGIVFTAALAKSHWDFTSFSTVEYEVNTYEISDSFQNISILSDTEDIFFVPSTDGKCTVTFVEKNNERHTAVAENGTLSIEKIKTEPQFTLFSTLSTSITVRLPEGEYETLRIREHTGKVELPGDYIFGNIDIYVTTGDVICSASSSGMLRINTDTGDIRATGIAAGELDLSVTTGRVEAEFVRCAGNMGVKVTTGKTRLTDVACGSFSSEGDTGDITLEKMTVAETLTIKRTTGDVKFQECDASELQVTTDTGDVTGTLLSEKVFITRSDTGRINVPETVTGGRCKITTDTGNIEISIP